MDLKTKQKPITFTSLKNHSHPSKILQKEKKAWRNWKQREREILQSPRTSGAPTAALTQISIAIDKCSEFFQEREWMRIIICFSICVGSAFIYSNLLQMVAAFLFLFLINRFLGWIASIRIKKHSFGIFVLPKSFFLNILISEENNG